MDDEQILRTASTSTVSARWREAMGSFLDRLVRPRLTFAGRSWPSYGFFVVVGCLSGIFLSLAIASATGLSLVRTLGTLAGGVAVALTLAFVLQTVRGEERYTFYHYQIVVLAACALLLLARGGPLLAYLDLIGLTLGVALAVGRCGCLLAGCCHGRPHAWGVRYGARHADNGFKPCLLGVRLFPIQPVETAVLLVIVAAVSQGLLEGRHPPGYALASYLILYDGLRFAIEFGRGDAARPHLFGFSEAQWTSIGSAAVIMAAESAGVLPGRWWHFGLGLLLMAALLAVAGYRRWSPRSVDHVLNAAHALEIAEGLDRLASDAPAAGALPRVLATRAGLKLSRGMVEGRDAGVHYALSFAAGHGAPRAARAIATLILRLRHPATDARLIAGRHGVFHLVVPARPEVAA
jgi:hypothetical protein